MVISLFLYIKTFLLSITSIKLFPNSHKLYFQIHSQSPLNPFKKTTHISLSNSFKPISPSLKPIYPSEQTLNVWYFPMFSRYDNAPATQVPKSYEKVVMHKKYTCIIIACKSKKTIIKLLDDKMIH